jgi:tetratricopeptide (TPR) repeat protein
VAETQIRLVVVLMRQNKFQEAEAPAREMVTTQVELFGETSHNAAPYLAQLGRLLCKLEKPDEAEPLLSQALATYRAVHPPGHWITAGAATDLGICLVALNRHAEAEPLLLEGYDGSQRAPRFRKNDGPKALRALVDLYTALNQPDQARHYERLLNP